MERTKSVQGPASLSLSRRFRSPASLTSPVSTTKGSRRRSPLVGAAARIIWHELRAEIRESESPGAAAGVH